MSDEGKNTNDEKSPASGKFESTSKEDLIKLVKNHMILKKKLEFRISELTTANLTFCQTEDELRNQIDDEKIKSKHLTIELGQYKSNESKLQQELTITRESLECFQLQNDSFKSSCKNFQDEISNLQNELSNVRSSSSHIEEDLTTKLNESKNIIENLLNEKQSFEEEKVYLSQCIENLESMNEELKSELDDLRSKSDLFEKDKHDMDEEINNYRKQIEDFQLEKIEFNKFQEQSSIIPIDQQEEHISKVLSDIPTLLHSVGITNEDFSSPLNLDSILRLCSLLIERCKFLQNNDRPINSSIDKDLVSIIQNDDYQCRVSIHRQNHSGLDTLFERLYTWMDQSIPSNDWQIVLSKTDDQGIQLEFNDIKFVSEKIEHDLLEVRHQLDQLLKENEDQRREIAILNENLHSSEQVQEQSENINELQTILKKETIKYDQLDISYQKLQQKCLLAEQLQSNYDLLKEDLNTKEIQLQDQRDKINELKTILEKETIKFDQTDISYQELQQKYLLTEQLQADYDLLKEDLNTKDIQLQDQRDKINELKTILEKETIKFDQTDISYQELQQKYLLTEQLQADYDLLKEDLNTKDIQLQDQRDKINELKTILEKETIKFDQTDISYQELQQKYLLTEQLQADYDLLKEDLNTKDIQLQDQRDKINELQTILEKETFKFDQTDITYQELQQKYLLTEQLQSNYDLLKEDLNTKEIQLQDQQEINNKLKTDNERQHLYLLERDENIHLLKLEIEQQKQSLDNTNYNQDERHSTLLKQHQQLSDLLETKMNETKQLTEKNLQLENDLKDNNQLFFEKTKQADDLDRQLQLINNEYEDFKIRFDQLQEGKKKVNNEINLLMDKIQNLEIYKSQSIQIIDNLKQELQNNKLNFDQTIEKKNKTMQQEKIGIENKLQQTIKNLQQELELNKNNLKDLQLKYTEEKQSVIENEQQASVINNLQLEFEKLQQENEKLHQTINELNHKLENQITESDEKIRDLKEKCQKMKVLLSRLKNELHEKSQQPKQSLIDLELADYEKTIKTLKEDLTNKDKEIQDLRDELTTITEKNTSLKQEMENLEEQKLQTEERANKFKTLLDTTKKDLQNAKDLEQERYHNDGNVRGLMEKLQIELDNNKVSMSQLLSDKQQLIERLNSQNETSQRTINLLEQNLSITKHDLDVAKQDYDTLQDDFNSYKIRAQSVLKQNKSIQRERTPSMADQNIEFEETIEKLKTTLREANHKIQLLISENEALQKEQDRLTETQAKLINESRKREQDLRKQHQIELDKTENECLKRTNDSHDMMKNAALQNETLSTTFKEQIAAIEADHERSISLLQNQLQVSKQEIEQLKNRMESLRQTSIDNEKESSQIGINNEFNKDDLPWAYSERQQGEGSESVSTDYQSTDVAVKTLENVLFGNTTNNRNSPSNQEKPRHVLFEDVELERQRIEEELNKTKFRLLNTTELLNESELNNVRLSEQVTLLKDEIRRIERNMDRAESISNLEYLKNVILKFFILKSTPERLQLIPVLVTMLKLSPDEQAKLVLVAQQTTSTEDYTTTNESNTQQVTSTANENSSTWSSYLSMW